MKLFMKLLRPSSMNCHKPFDEIMSRKMTRKACDATSDKKICEKINFLGTSLSVYYSRKVN
jgi:hypothetical protein